MLCNYWDETGELPVVVCTSFCGRNGSDGFEQSPVIEQVHPFQRSQFNGLPDSPAQAPANELLLVRPVDGLGQCVVAVVAPSIFRCHHVHLDQVLAIVDQQVLRVSLTVKSQRTGACRLMSVPRLLQSVKHEFRLHCGAHKTDDDASGEHVDNEDYIQSSLSGRNTGEVRRLGLTGPIGPESSIDLFLCARLVVITGRRVHHLATYHAAQAHCSRHPLHRPAGCGYALAFALVSDLVGPGDLQVLTSHARDPWAQRLVVAPAHVALTRIAPKPCMMAVTRRGDLQNSADRRDPGGIADGHRRSPPRLEPAVGLCLDEKRTDQLRGFIGPAQLRDLALQPQETRRLSRSHAVAHANVDLVRLRPRHERVQYTADLRYNRFHRGSPRRVCASPHQKKHANCALTYFRKTSPTCSWLHRLKGRSPQKCRVLYDTSSLRSRFETTNLKHLDALVPRKSCER